MDIIELLKQVAERELTPEEEDQLLNELSAAYHRDEASISSRAVQRIEEKVTAKLASNSGPRA